MKIFVKQKGSKYVISLMDGADIVKESTVSNVNKRDEIVWEYASTYDVLDIVIQEDSVQKEFKYSPIPSIPIHDEDEASDFFEENKSFVYNRIYEAVKEGCEFMDTSIRLFELNGTGVYITSQRKDWLSGLQDALEYYVEVENYEKCSEIQVLMNKL